MANSAPTVPPSGVGKRPGNALRREKRRAPPVRAPGRRWWCRIRGTGLAHHPAAESPPPSAVRPEHGDRHGSALGRAVHVWPAKVVTQSHYRLYHSQQHVNSASITDTALCPHGNAVPMQCSSTRLTRSPRGASAIAICCVFTTDNGYSTVVTPCASRKECEPGLTVLASPTRVKGSLEILGMMCRHERHHAAPAGPFHVQVRSWLTENKPAPTHRNFFLSSLQQ